VELDFLISQLTANGQRFQALAASIPSEQMRWKSDAKSWSILEVINHMADEEKEDFRVFLDFTLHRPGEVKPKIAPQDWAIERKYNEKDPGESRQDFITARESSLTWLRSIAPPDWEATYAAPWGPIRAGDIAAAWIAHDILHLRQIVKIHWDYTGNLLEPYITLYAGEW